MNFENMKSKCQNISSMLKNFSHPERLLILCYLAEGEKSVNDICQKVGLSQSQTSQFLKRMQTEGLLGSRREGNFSFYYILDVKIKKLIKSMQKIFCE